MNSVGSILLYLGIWNVAFVVYGSYFLHVTPMGPTDPTGPTGPTGLRPIPGGSEVEPHC